MSRHMTWRDVDEMLSPWQQQLRASAAPGVATVVSGPLGRTQHSATRHGGHDTHTHRLTTNDC